MQSGEEFPSTFLSRNRQVWTAHSVWFERTHIEPKSNANDNDGTSQDHTPTLKIQGEIIDLISQSPVKVQRRNEKPTSTTAQVAYKKKNNTTNTNSRKIVNPNRSKKKPIKQM